MTRRGALGRLWRAYGPARNPLRRATDRAEAALVAGLAIAFLVGAPVAALTAAGAAYQAFAGTQRAQDSSFHLVRAVLLPGGHRVNRSDLFGQLDVTARARWAGPGRVPRIGEITVPAGVSAARTVMVWTDEAGHPAGPPITHAQVVAQEIVVAFFTPVVLACLLLLAWALVRRGLDRRRLAAWEADWLATEPRWSGRR